MSNRLLCISPEVVNPLLRNFTIFWNTKWLCLQECDQVSPNLISRHGKYHGDKWLKRNKKMKRILKKRENLYAKRENVVDCNVVRFIDLNSAPPIRCLLVNEFLRITCRQLDKSGFSFSLSISFVAFQLLTNYSALVRPGIGSISSKIRFNNLQSKPILLSAMFQILINQMRSQQYH